MGLEISRYRIGEILESSGYISQEQLNEALAYQKTNKNKRLADIFIELGYITEAQKLEALGKRLGMPVVSIGDQDVDLSVVGLVPRETAMKYSVIATGVKDGKIQLAVNDPLNFFAVEDVRQLVKKPISVCLAPLDEINKAIEYYYSEVNAKRAASKANLSADVPVKITEQAAARDSDDAPVVKLLNSLLVKGYNSNVSDIHIEPFEDKVVVRMRVDGMIVEYVTLVPSLHQPLIARIKILSNLDIAEKRAPQDGHFRIMLDGIDMNIRVSMMPTVYGEKAVLRFLTTNAVIDNDGNFGMDEENYGRMLKLLDSPHGIIYLTGPTGSGKTTTLYMILEYLSKRLVNITTVEDPVERNIPRINQSQVNPAAGLTFDSGLRSILRQDPDIIMVGETRDAETAEISVRAAITGHLVLSTLHTNDSISSIIRLEDMGIPRHLVSSSVVGVVAQRLVRKVCPECGVTYAPDETELKALGVNAKALRKGRGCHQCNNTGYKGRTAIHEIVAVDREMRRLITVGASVDEMRDYAIRVQGAKMLRDSVLKLVLNGTTTVEEFIKTTYYS